MEIILTPEHSLRNAYQVMLFNLASKTLTEEQEVFIIDLIRDQLEREIACIPELSIVDEV